MTRDWRKTYFFIAALVFVLDRVTKLAVQRSIPLYDAVTVIPGVFRISHVLNTGAAFGIFNESSSPYKMVWLVGFSLVALLVVVSLLVRAGRAFSWSALALALILGGAAGNLWDRLRFGHVVDFLQVNIVGYHWPDFNAADSAIVVGACLLILDMFFFSPRVDTSPARAKNSL